MSKTLAEKHAKLDKKPNKVVASVKNAVNEANILLRNIEQFVEAVCLLILAYAGYFTAFNVTLRNEYQYVLMFAAVLIGMRGSLLVIKSINKK
jgi:hypothetical protein